LRLNQFVGGDAEEPAQRISAKDLAEFLTGRVSAFRGRDDWQGTFIDNHDQLRTLVRLQKLGVPLEESKRRLDLAAVLLMTVRGIPIILYGDEQYLANYNDNHNTPPKYINSDDDDPFNRVGMTSFDESARAFQIIKTLANLRKESPAIQRGSYIPIYADQDALVFLRVSESDVVLVAVNRGTDKEVVLPANNHLREGKYVDLLDGTRAQASADDAARAADPSGTFGCGGGSGEVVDR